MSPLSFDKFTPEEIQPLIVRFNNAQFFQKPIQAIQGFQVAKTWCIYYG
jgi:hypothetical protein